MGIGFVSVLMAVKASSLLQLCPETKTMFFFPDIGILSKRRINIFLVVFNIYSLFDQPFK